MAEIALANLKDWHLLHDGVAITLSDYQFLVRGLGMAQNTSSSPACDEIREGCRLYGIGSHLVFYVETTDSVDVVRILHQRMDPMRHL